MTLAATEQLSYGRSFMGWVKQLSDDDRRSALVAVMYQQLRRKREPFYRALPFPGPRATNSRNFKTFATIKLWMEGVGWKISLKEPGWQNFMAYVFENFCPDSRPDALPPAPGQLKHPLLLKRFLNDNTITGEIVANRSKEALNSLYAEIEAMRNE